MLLRTRISLIVTLAFVTICVGFVVAAIQREEVITERFAGEIVSDRSVVWDRVIDKIVQRMEVNAGVISENEALVSSVRMSDGEAIRRLADDVHENLSRAGIAGRLDLVATDGSLVYSSSSALFPTASVSEENIARSLADGEIISGLSNDQQRNIVVAVVVPLHDGQGIAGLGVLATGIHEAISEMENVTRSTVLLVNRRGRLLAGEAVDLWRFIQSHVDLLQSNSLQTLAVDDKVYSAILVPEESDLGTLRANLVSVRDVTDVAAQQRRLRDLMIWGTAVALAVVLILLNMYMSWVFAPLAAGINMLNALSRGNLGVRLENGGDRDEVGRIANALNIFRSRMVAMDRLRQSRERQRARQERFIRREMTSLADTLDDEERIAVLEELHNVEAMVQERAETAGNSFSQAAKSLDRFDEESEQDLEEGTEKLLRDAELDGLAMMAIAFQKMSDRVQDQNQRLRDALATKNQLIAIQKELDIAAKVQLSLMPDPLPASSVFSISGTMKPAKEVGGDFFDYFRIDENKVGIVIADVSGKGVPAALFMVMARTVLRATIRRNQDSPGEVLRRVNDFLERNNAEQMFVTVFFGVLYESTGRFIFANGGHNPPILVRNGGAVPLELTGGVILGMIDSLDYDESHIDLSPGDRLVFVTDGLSEAFNKESEAYGDERLIAAAAEAAAHPTQGPDENIAEIVRSVEKFVGDAPQFDDITCVVLHYKRRGAEETGGTIEVLQEEVPGRPEPDSVLTDSGSVLSFTIKNRLEELARLADIIDARSEERNWPDGWAINLNVCLDELITNVISYGYRDHPDGRDAESDEIRIVVIEADDDLIVEMEDHGSSYNPFVEAPEPDVDASVKDRKIGGLGVYLVKQLTDEASWERRGDINHIRLVKHGLNRTEE